MTSVTAQTRTSSETSVSRPTVEPDNLVSIDLAATVFGTTRRAIEGRIHKGKWLEGRQFHRAPDGTIWIDRKGVRQWVLQHKA